MASSLQLLVVTAVDAERDAVTRDLGPAELVNAGPYSLVRVRCGAGTIDVLSAGIGPVAAAAATATVLAVNTYDAAISAGIAGGFEGFAVGDVVIADSICFADLGAHSPDGFLHHGALGWHPATITPPPDAVESLRELIAAAGLAVSVGPVLTLSAVTGTNARAAELAATHTPHAEAMEGAGVAHAAAVHRLPALELRTISNAVGDRNKSAWDLPTALKSLSLACAAAFSKELPLGGVL
jgi:futalosine hydrolase